MPTKVKPGKEDREVAAMREKEARERQRDRKRDLMANARPLSKVATTQARQPEPLPIRKQLMDLCNLRGTVTDLELFETAVNVIRTQQTKLTSQSGGN